MKKDFLPMTMEEAKKRGWNKVDFVYVCGDAYVDHPSFGAAIITRVLEANGYKVGMICQPDWKDDDSIDVFGEPELGFIVSAGNMDSMVNHYTVAKKRRRQDMYSPGGEMAKRPDHAAIVYGNLIRRKYPKGTIILGGIEASLRRLAHYDYWDNKLRRSILLDASADIVLYGMGERSIVEVADALKAGIAVSDISFVEGSVYKTKSLDSVYDYELLPSFPSMQEEKVNYAKSFAIQYQNTDPFSGKRLVEPYKEKEYIVQNPPAKPLSKQEMDDVYSLPYMKAYHPSYEEAGGIPAISEVKFSLISNRGCFGGCSFCALTFHQGRIIQARSHESLIEEATEMTKDPDFKGYIHDVGGPTANFRFPACKKQMEHGTCKNRQCLFPTPCKNMEVDHRDYVELLRKLRKIPKVKKVFIRSGIRFDYAIYDKNPLFMEELCKYHVSGQLKVAPEHVAANVLDNMGKPRHEVYEHFCKKYKEINDRIGKKQYLVPYLMSSHPGSTINEAITLAEYLKKINHMPEQVQDFYPTPSTLSTCMYYTGLNPITMKPVYVPKNPREKAKQRALMQFQRPENYELVYEALKEAGRKDLVGFDNHCLIRPRGIGKDKINDKKEARTDNKNRGKSSGKAVGKSGTSSSVKMNNKMGKARQKSDRNKKKTIRNMHRKKKG